MASNPRLLGEGEEVAADVGVDKAAGEGGDGADDEFSGAGEGALAAEGAAGDGEYVPRIVVARGGVGAGLDEPETIPSPADEEVLHFRCDRLDGQGEIGEIDAEDVIGVALVDLRRSIRNLCQSTHSLSALPLIVDLPATFRRRLKKHKP